jgi:hypothetical protein
MPQDSNSSASGPRNAGMSSVASRQCASGEVDELVAINA